MRHVVQTVTLTSEAHYGKRVPPAPFGALLKEIPAVLRGSTLMAFQGRSTARGHYPAWLSAVADIRLVDYSGQDETVLHFEAPPLGEAAPDLYEQLELWPSRPDPADTCFDLLGDVLLDVNACNENSDRFDYRLLNRLVRLKGVFNGTFQVMLVRGQRTQPGHLPHLDRQTINTAEEFRAKTPLPARVRIVGALDMMRASTDAFAIRLDDRREVQGVFIPGGIARCKDLFQQRVLVVGAATFRPSGQVLRIEADQMSRAGAEPAMWSRVPLPRDRQMDVEALRKPQGPRSGLAAVIGRWPGDETDEQVQAALRGIS